ncbi:MAG: RNA polymerase sigma factor [Ignavibacteriaceae bacterium]|nr:RNA polymerase sigma factor [Ignavibacteriaceae bacterium]
MNRAKEGDSKAFADLSKNISDISHSYFLSKHRQGRIINIDDVDDLTNNVYIAFAEQFDNIGILENWLRRVLFLTFIRWYKQNKSKTFVELNDSIFAKQEQDLESINIDAATALNFLSKLSDEKQEIVKLRFWGGLKFSEIAERMKKTEVAVKKMFYRTLNELKEKLD